MSQSGERRVAAFVDWENIRLRLADNYVEKVPPEKILAAIEAAANEIGRLHQCTVFGDWSLRREEAALIQQRPRFRPHLVLRVGRKDQTDPAMIAEIFEAIVSKETLGIDDILLCAGDSNYADIIRRGFLRDVNMHVCAVGKDVSRELTALAPFYPLERYLEVPLIPKQEQQVRLGAIGQPVDPRMARLIDLLNSVEKRLPYVAYLYFRDKILPLYQSLGEDKELLLREAERQGILVVTQRENPVRPGSLFRCVALDRENELVQQVLGPTKRSDADI